MARDADARAVLSLGEQTQLVVLWVCGACCPVAVARVSRRPGGSDLSSSLSSPAPHRKSGRRSADPNVPQLNTWRNASGCMSSPETRVPRKLFRGCFLNMEVQDATATRWWRLGPRSCVLGAFHCTCVHVHQLSQWSSRISLSSATVFTQPISANLKQLGPICGRNDTSSTLYKSNTEFTTKSVATRIPACNSVGNGFNFRHLHFVLAQLGRSLLCIASPRDTFQLDII